MKNKNMIIMILVIVIVAAGSFFGGMEYQQSKAAAALSNGQFGQSGQAGRFGGAARGGRGGGATQGEVLSIDVNSITIKLPDGSSKIINLSGSTMFSKADQASKTDVKVGAKIAAFGMTNSDGSITATNIQLNPMMFRGRGGPTPSVSPTK